MQTLTVLNWHFKPFGLKTPLGRLHCLLRIQGCCRIATWVRYLRHQKFQRSSPVYVRIKSFDRKHPISRLVTLIRAYDGILKWGSFRYVVSTKQVGWPRSNSEVSVDAPWPTNMSDHYPENVFPLSINLVEELLCHLFICDDSFNKNSVFFWN